MRSSRAQQLLLWHYGVRISHAEAELKVQVLEHSAGENCPCDTGLQPFCAAPPTHTCVGMVTVTSSVMPCAKL